METPEPSAVQVVAGFALLVALFVVREVASGALREAGKDAWAWVKRRPNRRRGLTGGRASVERPRGCARGRDHPAREGEG